MFSKSEPEVVFFKYKYNENFRKATFSAPKRPHRGNVKNNEMKKYPAPIGISAKKKEDLLKLCTKDLIPQRYHSFYQSLPVTKNQKE